MNARAPHADAFIRASSHPHYLTGNRPADHGSGGRDQHGAGPARPINQKGTARPTSTIWRSTTSTPGTKPTLPPAGPL